MSIFVILIGAAAALGIAYLYGADQKKKRIAAEERAGGSRPPALRAKGGRDMFALEPLLDNSGARYGVRCRAAGVAADDDVDTRGARNAAIASTYIQATAGDFIVRENNTTRSKTLSDTGTNTYEKLKEMGVDKTGTLRIKFSARATGWISGHNGTAYFRIYKNGAAVGTERSITFTTSSWVSNSWTEDLSFTEGDLVQIYARGFTSTGEGGTLEITAFSVCAGNYGINLTA